MLPLLLTAHALLCVHLFLISLFNFLVALKVLWPLALAKEGGPNVNSSSSRRERLQEQQREPGGMTCKYKLGTNWVRTWWSFEPDKSVFLTACSSRVTLCYAVTRCSQPRGCPLMVTHWSTHSTRMGIATSWQSQTLMLRTLRNWSWTAGLENPFLVICTGPVCMRGCCWPYMTEVQQCHQSFKRSDLFMNHDPTFHPVCRSASAEDLRRPADGDGGEGLLHGPGFTRCEERSLVLWGDSGWHAPRDGS